MDQDKVKFLLNEDARSPGERLRDILKMIKDERENYIQTNQMKHDNALQTIIDKTLAPENISKIMKESMQTIIREKFKFIPVTIIMSMKEIYDTCSSVVLQVTWNRSDEERFLTFKEVPRMAPSGGYTGEISRIVDTMTDYYARQSTVMKTFRTRLQEEIFPDFEVTYTYVNIRPGEDYPYIVVKLNGN